MLKSLESLTNGEAKTCITTLPFFTVPCLVISHNWLPSPTKHLLTWLEMVFKVMNWAIVGRRCRRRGFDSCLGKTPQAGHGNPLKYSCLENPTDRKAWRATDHKATQRWTRMKQRSIQQRELLGFPASCSYGRYPSLKGLKSVTKSCVTLCDPMDCSPPGSSVHGSSQTRIV